MRPSSELSRPARLGLLLFLWSVLAAITLLMGGKVLPHVVELPLVGWPLVAFLGTGILAMWLGALRLSASVIRGDYPAA
jgi:hypothetical protein